LKQNTPGSPGRSVLPFESKTLFHPILDLGKRRPRALFVEIPAGRAAHSERADRSADAGMADKPPFRRILERRPAVRPPLHRLIQQDEEKDQGP